jgi:hypothetical protein
MKFTAEGIAKLTLAPTKDDRIEWNDDIPGHGIRLRRRRKSVARYWVIDYAIGEAIPAKDPDKKARKKKRRFTYGTYPAMKGARCL